MATPRVLFVTPAATRSGAPMLLMHLVRWLRSTGADVAMSAVLVTDGAMAAAFAAEMPTAAYDRYDGVPRPTLAQRAAARLPAAARRRQAARVARCRAVVGTWPPDLVFCNSAVAAGVLDALGPYPCPVVAYLHEMEHVLRTIDTVPGGAFPALAKHVTHYLTGSEAVRRNLTGRHAVPPDRVTTVHDFILTGEFDAPPPPDPARLAALGVPAGVPVVGFVATAEWRKGADLLVPLARATVARFPGLPVHFVWVGGGHPAEVDRLRFDVETAGLSDRVHLAGPTNRTADWYPAFTMFALPSREDPFPLVALEAAAAGVPVVCFADGGGMPEFVEDDAGVVVPFLDLTAFADALGRLAGDPALCDRLGRRAAEKVRRRHDAAVAVPQLMAVLNRLLTHG